MTEKEFGIALEKLTEDMQARGDTKGTRLQKEMLQSMTKTFEELSFTEDPNQKSKPKGDPKQLEKLTEHYWDCLGKVVSILTEVGEIT